MSMNLFLRIDGMPGDAVAKGHEDWIPVTSVDWGAAGSGPARQGGGAGAGKVTFRPIVFTSWVSIATPLLLAACARGTHVGTATFETLRAGDAPALLARWDLEEVAVAEVGVAGSAGDPSLGDSFALTYRRIRLTTFAADAAGGQGTPTASGWDLAANQPW